MLKHLLKPFRSTISLFNEKPPHAACVRRWSNSCLDVLNSLPGIRLLPGVRYLALYEADEKGHQLVIRLPLSDLRLTDIQLEHSDTTLIVRAPGYHENGRLKAHWISPQTGYGTWRRRYRVKSPVNPASVRLVESNDGVDVVINHHCQKLSA